MKHIIETMCVDSLSDQFTGQQANFTLKSSAGNVSGLTTDNAIILVNDVFQTHYIKQLYFSTQTTTGITTITFTGTGSSVSADPNVGTLPSRWCDCFRCFY